jgi:DNA-binding transcriptional regulator YdaS (Cro superfamily)
MDLKTYLATLTPEAREKLAKKAGTSKKHLTNVSYGYRTLNAKACVAVSTHSNGAVSLAELRPHDAHLIWPKKVKRSAANA